MKLKKYKSVGGDAYELICTTEEREMLRELLEHEGVNLGTSVYSPKECTVYVRNPYKNAVGGWGSELCKKMANEFFARGKKGRF